MKRIVLGALALLSGCSDSTPKQAYEMPSVPVHAASIEVRDVPLFFEAIGVVKPAKTAEVKSFVPGIIKKVHFTEGDRINEGALLYTLDETPSAIRVREAEARRDQSLIDLLRAKKKLERYKSLTNQDLISKIEWDEMESAVVLHRAVLKADEARLAAARLDLEHCQIKAPISGLAGKSGLHEGNMIVGSETLVTLMQIEPLYVDFSITEKELREVAGIPSLIQVCPVGKEDVVGEGKVTFLDHAIDSKTGMLAVRGTITKEAGQFVWPGQTVSVRVCYGKKESARLVPMRAIKTGQDGPYLFAIKEDQTVEILPVKLGPEERGLVVVEEGVGVDAKVVTEGHHRLFPGSKIEEVAR